MKVDRSYRKNILKLGSEHRQLLLLLLEPRFQLILVALLPVVLLGQLLPLQLFKLEAGESLEVSIRPGFILEMNIETPVLFALRVARLRRPSFFKAISRTFTIPSHIFYSIL